ncbi:hypothetical protein V493_06918 [Pseudogymnoascus sp. VKM F-4281 (FW-2241)]|nr:hypothetical protein V493_06918 [Pseudogymnoascus sp. VKM F-4281 (FW-2241)]
MFPPNETLDADHRSLWPWKRWFAREEPLTPRPDEQAAAPRSNLARRISRKAIPGLPRPGTFKRQQSELRHNLEGVKAKQNERRAFSVDPHRAEQLCDSPKTSTLSLPRNSAPTLIGVPVNDDVNSIMEEQQTNPEVVEPEIPRDDLPEHPAPPSIAGSDDLLDEELEKRWILNLSMHFRDRSNREKFFVTYAETPTHWRRVTISLDYREAPPNSLEEELQQTQYQRDKSARIYAAIRESLPDIQFYDTVTNLKLQTESERLHVHVTEDIHEVILFPPVSAINHLFCQRVKEQDLVFDSHLSGFVYKVTVNGHVYIKKEIPGPDTVEEFLYEVNALHRLSNSDSVIKFGGVITSNDGAQLKGLLISFAEKGALIDVIFEGKGELSWPRRERWAKQIVQGLSEIHEGIYQLLIPTYLFLKLTFLLAGFVQGDFTLSNIVIDDEDNAKIIDINRRGCPVGWEPPEVAALIDSKQRISMYIGVKSDIFQLGMVLWALAMQQDEPEIQPRPLTLASAQQEIPSYYRALVGICLSDDPRTRCHTTSLLSMFPELESDDHGRIYGNQPSDHVEAQYIDPAHAVERDDIDNFRLMDSQTTERGGLAPSTGTHTYVNAPTDMSGEAYFFPRRGRSPPRSATEEHALEPHIVTVSPGRHYLAEYQVSEVVTNDIVDDFVAPHGLVDNHAIGGNDAVVRFDIEDAVGDNEHTNSGENRHAIDYTEDSLDDANRINNAAENVTASPTCEVVATQNITTTIANESASLINGDAGETGTVASRDERSEDVLESLGNATESNAAVSGDCENIQNPAATANEDAGDKKGDASENHMVTPDNGGESTLDVATTAMSNDSGYAQSATQDDSTVAGFKGDDIVATESMNGDYSYITGDVTIAAGDGIKETPNLTVKNSDEGANNASADTFTDNSGLEGGARNITDCNDTGNGVAVNTTHGETSNEIENEIKDNTVLGGASHNTDDVVTGNGIVSKEAVEQSVAPRGEAKYCGEVTGEEFVILGVGTKQHPDEGVLAARGVVDIMKERNNNLEQMDAAIGDLTGIGGHSTLEHSEIPQGISDDDLMTDTR